MKLRIFKACLSVAPVFFSSALLASVVGEDVSPVNCPSTGDVLSGAIFQIKEDGKNLATLTIISDVKPQAEFSQKNSRYFLNGNERIIKNAENEKRTLFISKSDDIFNIKISQSDDPRLYSLSLVSKRGYDPKIDETTGLEKIISYHTTKLEHTVKIGNSYSITVDSDNIALPFGTPNQGEEAKTIEYNLTACGIYLNENTDIEVDDEFTMIEITST